MSAINPFILGPLGNAVLNAPNALSSIVDRGSAVVLEDLSSKDLQEVARAASLVTGEIVQGRLGSKWHPKHMVASVLLRLSQRFEKVLAPVAMQLETMARSSLIYTYLLPLSGNSEMYKKFAISRLQATGEIFRTALAEGEFERAARAAVLRHHVVIQLPPQENTHQRTNRLFHYPQTATFADIAFLVETISQTSRIGENAIPYAKTLHQIARDHYDPDLRSTAKAEAARLNVESRRSMDALLNGLADVDTDLIWKELNGAIEKGEYDERFNNLILILVRHGEERHLNALMQHRLPRVRGLTVLSVVAYLGRRDQLPSLWTDEQGPIARDLKSDDPFIREQAVGELTSFSLCGVEGAKRWIKQIIASSGDSQLRALATRALTMVG
ncbi:MAG: hypothetical protein Q7T03_07925 [Deltaproteobacteria bacterium]|nr:hypothetical protein [Deltaproteobacteria bacterium]